MVTVIVIKTFTNHGTSAPLVENVTKLVLMATVMTKFAMTVAKLKCQEAAIMFTWSVPNSVAKIQNAKPSHFEIQTFLEMVHLHACSWMKFTAHDQVLFYFFYPRFYPKSHFTQVHF